MGLYLIINAVVLVYGASYFGFCCKHKKNSSAIATFVILSLMVALMTMLLVFRINA